VTSDVVVVGLGEVGRPLLELIRRKGRSAVGIDLAPAALPERGSVAVLHVCYPFEIPNFVGEAARYIELFAPPLTIVNSTVGVGTTRAIYERTGARIAHSPVRGKHSRMLEELTRYTKYIGGIDARVAADAAEHFRALGVPTRVLASPEATEFAKLTETTYFGLLIAWAQEVERYCVRLDLDYGEVASFYEEIGYLPPVKYFPGVIGGHCVMPNIEILDRVDGGSPILDAIRWSDAQKRARGETPHRAPAPAS
jgi:UDP-N-acetyl-D-mannosaminuronate dehydrogenase